MLEITISDDKCARDNDILETVSLIGSEHPCLHFKTYLKFGESSKINSKQTTQIHSYKYFDLIKIHEFGEVNNLVMESKLIFRYIKIRDVLKEMCL